MRIQRKSLFLWKTCANVTCVTSGGTEVWREKYCPGVTGETWPRAGVDRGWCRWLTKPCRADEVCSLRNAPWSFLCSQLLKHGGFCMMLEPALQFTCIDKAPLKKIVFLLFVSNCIKQKQLLEQFGLKNTHVWCSAASGRFCQGRLYLWVKQRRITQVLGQKHIEKWD